MVVILGLESDGNLTYNPSTGTLNVPNISVTGTQTIVNSVTMNASNAVIFEGATADAHETTLSTIDATGDRTINLPNVSGTLPVLAAASATAITSTPEELNLLDGITAGTVIASKAIITDSNIDITGGRNITISGELDAATLDISGDADIDGTTNLDVVDIDGAVDIASSLTMSGGSGGDIIIVDNGQIEIGSASGGDLRLYHDASDSYINNQGTGHLKIRGNDVRIEDSSSGHSMGLFIEDGGVENYHNNVKKFETNAGGFKLTGTAGTSPLLELTNGDSEDGDTGRESTLRFTGKRSGGEAVTNAQISGHHDGAADDDKGMILFNTNDGSNNTEKMRITSAGNVGIGLATPNEGGYQAGARVLSIEGAAADDFGVLELLNPKCNKCQ